jgi:hypothetical protein
MTTGKNGVSFYFFDVDDNVMFLTTPLLIKNTSTNEIEEISTGEFALINPFLGKSGDWADWAIYKDTFKFFNDIPESQKGKRKEQYFVRDIQKAIESEDDKWQGPSWKLFQGACSIQAPLAIITARGHSPETIMEGIKVLYENKLISNIPVNTKLEMIEDALV